MGNSNKGCRQTPLFHCLSIKMVPLIIENKKTLAPDVQMDIQIEARDLTKQFGNIVAVDQVSFKIRKCQKFESFA